MASKKVIGIDIGSKYIKIAFVKRSRKKHEVVRTIFVSTPADSVVDGEIRNADTLTARIRGALLEYKYNATELYFSINANSVVTREIKLPALKEKEIDPAIEFELTQSFPGIIQSHTISSRIYSDPGMPVEGTTVFCPNKVLDDFVEVAKGLLIPLKGIDINANALTKVVHAYLPPERKNETLLVVDIGNTMSQVSLISAGKLVLSRQVPTGLARFDNLVSNRAGITLEQAERARQNNKFDIYNLDREDVDGLVNVAFSSINSQIRGILDYYRYNKPEEVISGILMFTGRGLETALNDYFNQSTELPVELIRLRIKGSEYPDSDAMAAAAIGATMIPAVGRRDINLMPRLKEIREATLRRIKLTRAVALVIAIAVFSLMAYGYLVYLRYTVAAETMSTQEEIIRYSSINETKNKLEQAKNLLASAEGVLSKYNASVTSGTDLFNTINKAMPDSIFAVTFSLSEDGVIAISGITRERPDLSDFIYNLKESGKIERVALSSIITRSSEDGGAIDYNFTVEIIPKKAGAENEN
jgi:type IV pilus assembly protein PilM